MIVLVGIQGGKPEYFLFKKIHLIFPLRKLEQLEEDRREATLSLPQDHLPGDMYWTGEEAGSNDSPANQQILRKLSEAESMLSRQISNSTHNLKGQRIN